MTNAAGAYYAPNQQRSIIMFGLGPKLVSAVVDGEIPKILIEVWCCSPSFSLPSTRPLPPIPTTPSPQPSSNNGDQQTARPLRLRYVSPPIPLTIHFPPLTPTQRILSLRPKNQAPPPPRQPPLHPHRPAARPPSSRPRIPRHNLPPHPSPRSRQRRLRRLLAHYRCHPQQPRR